MANSSLGWPCYRRRRWHQWHGTTKDVWRLSNLSSKASRVPTAETCVGGLFNKNRFLSPFDGIETSSCYSFSSKVQRKGLCHFSYCWAGYTSRLTGVTRNLSYVTMYSILTRLIAIFIVNDIPNSYPDLDWACECVAEPKRRRNRNWRFTTTLFSLWTQHVKRGIKPNICSSQKCTNAIAWGSHQHLA